MGRFGQVGIAIGALGAIISLMGLFPQLTGAAPTIGFGIVQVLMILGGQTFLLLGGMIYVKTTFYLGIRSTLAQSIGIRLTLTGILFAPIAGMADILGFGSHPRTATSDYFLGQLQGIGIILWFLIGAFGIIVYAIMGEARLSSEVTETVAVIPLEQALDLPTIPAVPTTQI